MTWKEQAARFDQLAEEISNLMDRETRLKQDLDEDIKQLFGMRIAEIDRTRTEWKAKMDERKQYAASKELQNNLEKASMFQPGQIVQWEKSNGWSGKTVEYVRVRTTLASGKVRILAQNGMNRWRYTTVEASNLTAINSTITEKLESRIPEKV